MKSLLAASAFFKKYFWIVSFAVVFVIFFSNLLFSKGIISYGDNAFFFDHDRFSVWAQYLKNGSDLSNTVFLHFFDSQFVRVFHFLGLSSDSIIAFFGFFIPIIFCVSVYFYLSKKMTGDYFFGFFANVFILLSNLSIEHLLFFPIQYFYTLAIFGITIIFTKKCFETGRIDIRDLIILSCISLFTLHPFFLIILLLYYFILFVYLFAINKHERKGILIKYVFLTIGIILINFYWILPFFSSMFFNNANIIYGAGNLDSVYKGYLDQDTAINIINQWTYPSSGKYLMPLDGKNFLSLIVNYFVISAFLLFGLLQNKNKQNKLKHLSLFIVVCFVVFFSLSFVGNNPLLSNLWNILWDRYEALHFFRSFGRFSILIIPLFVFLIFLNSGYKRIYTIVILLFIVSRFYVSFDFLHNAIRVYPIPEPYKALNDFLDKDTEIYSIVGFPVNQYESYVWNKTYAKFPQTYYFSELFLHKSLIYEKAANNYRENGPFYKKLFYGDDSDLLDSLKYLNAKYILVWKDAYNISTNSLVSYERYVSLFDRNFEKVIDNENFFLYKNKQYLPLLAHENIVYKKIGDEKYKISLRSTSKSSDLSFLTNFNGNWNLYLDKYSTIDNYKFLTGEAFSYFYKKPIFDDTHTMVYDYANRWTVDADYIKQNFSKEYYKENPDGSIDIELTLYFKPQSYFYLGLLVSGTALFGCFGYLGWGIRRRKIKNIGQHV
jgi:hypothetical protein